LRSKESEASIQFL